VHRLLDSRVSGLIFILVLLAGWELAVRTGTIKFLSFPALSSVIVNGWEFIRTGTILEVLTPSTVRLAFGYGLAVLIGVSVGLLMGVSRTFYNLLEPLTEVLRPMPSAAMVPILILFLGLDNEMKVAVITFASTFPILVNTYAGVRAVDPVQINTARTLGLPRSKVVRLVVLPAASPYIVAGMRISIAVSFVLVIVTEMLTGGGGLGAYILDSQRSFRVADTYVGVLTIGAFGYLINTMFLVVQDALFGWQKASTTQPG